MAAGLVGIIIGYGGKEFLDPSLKDVEQNVPGSSRASGPGNLMRSGIQELLSDKELRSGKLERLDREWAQIIKSGETGVEEVKNFSLNIRAKLERRTPYQLEDGRFCRDMRYEQVKTSPMKAIIMTACRGEDGTWSLVAIKEAED